VCIELIIDRWGYLNLVKYLLSKGFTWTLKNIQTAYESAQGEEVKALIKAEVKKNKSGSILKKLLMTKKNSSEE